MPRTARSLGDSKSLSESIKNDNSAPKENNFDRATNTQFKREPFYRVTFRFAGIRDNGDGVEF